MSCPECRHLTEIRRIRTPAELKPVITVIKSNVADGTIQEVPGARPPFNEIAPNRNWPDLINHEFTCQKCNQKFVLTVETYHGRGGYWDSLD